MEVVSYFLTLHLFAHATKQSRNALSVSDSRVNQLYISRQCIYIALYNSNMMFFIRYINNSSVYSYNNFQQIVVRIAANLILTTNDMQCHSKLPGMLCIAHAHCRTTLYAYFKIFVLILYIFILKITRDVSILDFCQLSTSPSHVVSMEHWIMVMWF